LFCWSETLNGRGAMLGLLIGLAVEQLSTAAAIAAAPAGF